MVRASHPLLTLLAVSLWGGVSVTPAHGEPPVVIETITVGNPGNIGDFHQTQGTFGAVGYVYAIGK